MAGTITAAVDATYPALRRIGVTLSGWVSPANGAITVKRVHPDTTEWTVRGFGATSGGAAFVWDYEAPFGVAVTYYAMDGTTKISSAAVTLASSQPMIRVPGLPSLDIAVAPVAKPTVKYPRRVVDLEPLGRDTFVALGGPRMAGRFALTLQTVTDGDSAALRAALRSALTVLLVWPSSNVPYRYVRVADLDEDPQVDWMLSSDGAGGQWTYFTLDCAVTDQPAGGIFGDPTASYAAIASTYATYTALKAAKATYLDVLKGV